MVRQIERRLRGKPLLPYTYRDFGSLLMHERALHGTARTVLDLAARRLSRATSPRVKLD
jgi:hypothetical protein